MATCDLYSHTVKRHFFRPCYKAHTSPSSKLRDYIGTMHLPAHLVLPVRQLGSKLNWEFFLDPSTMCLRYLLLGSGTIPTIARRLLSSTTCDLYSHTVERHLFRPCYKAYTSPSSKLGDYIGTMHLSVHLISPVRQLDSQFNWEFFLDPGTMCLRHLLPGSGTKWAHFTLW